MITTYGARVMSKGEGMLRPFKILNLVRLDEDTGDSIPRRLSSEGAGVRQLPVTVYAGFGEGDGHGMYYPNVVAGRVDAVEFDPENNTSTAWGWFLDDENGRKAAYYALTTQALRRNSIHMTEVEAHIEWGSDDPSDEGFWEIARVQFDKWSVGSTTLLGLSAFADSAFVSDEEITASLLADDSLIEFTVESSDWTFDANYEQPEITADGAPRPAWDHFFQPERPEPMPITLGDMDDNGWIPVCGNLARWNSCHDGFDGRCILAPHDPTDYASFNASSVLTDRGLVRTGPVFFLGGHPDKPLGNGDAAKAYGGIENAWADVRVTHGVHGPWISGVVRPGVTDDAVYAARASRISGHWATDGRLRAIVSCNVPGFDVNGVVTDADGNVLELVASFFPDCGQRFAPPAPAVEAEPAQPQMPDWLSPAIQALIAEQVQERRDAAAAVSVAAENFELERARTLALLDLEDEPAV